MTNPPIAYALDDQRLHMLVRAGDLAKARALVRQNSGLEFDALYPEPSNNGIRYVPLAGSFAKWLQDVSPLELEDREGVIEPVWEFLQVISQGGGKLFRSPSFWMRPDAPVAQEFVLFDSQLDALKELIRFQPVDRDRSESRRTRFTDTHCELLFDLGLTGAVAEDLVIRARTRRPKALSWLTHVADRVRTVPRERAVAAAGERVETRAAKARSPVL